MIEPQGFQTLQEAIRYCQSEEALAAHVQRILEPTGFGRNRLDDPGVDVSLDYLEMADCLKEADQRHFQQEIELLVFAHQQLGLIQAGQVPERPPVIQPWEFFT